MASYTIDPIATVHSPYRKKFAIPRQPGLVKAAKGYIELLAPYHDPNMLRGLEVFSHIWLIFIFHETQAQGWKPLVRPPRLGGNKKLGVYATRSTFRPNAIGMSVVKLDSITIEGKKTRINISALDLLDGTPIVDIKPYIPYSDALPNANGSFAQQSPEITISVNFNHQALNDIQVHQQHYPELSELITQVLEQDPRPAYKKSKIDDKVYGMQLYNLNICWQMQTANSIEVLSITYLT
jgi:tRNA-Thr(GGU) m(6)t(6)A37 methyltransferase TsaA